MGNSPTNNHPGAANPRLLHFLNQNTTMRDKTKILHRPWLYANYPWRAIDHSGWEFYCLVEPSVYGSIWLGHESTDKRGQLLSEAVPYWKETKQSFEEYQLKKTKQI
jgi:hypothetical protein